MKQEHFEILLEEMNTKFDLVMDGLRNLNESVNRRIDDLAQETRERFDVVDVKFDAVHQRLDRLEKRVDGIDVKLDAVAADLSAHRADTEAHPRCTA